MNINRRALSFYLLTIACLWVARIPALDPNETRLEDTGLIREIGFSKFRHVTIGSNSRQFRFTPRGDVIAIGSYGSVRLWKFPSGEPLHDVSGVASSYCIGFTDKGETFLVLNRREMNVYRFSVKSGRLVGTTPLLDVVDEKGSTRHWISDNGKWLTSTEVYGNVNVWDLASGKRVLRTSSSRCSPFYAPVTDEGVMTFWDNLFVERYRVQTGELLSRSNHYRKRVGLVSTPDGAMMGAYSLEESGFVFWDSATGAKSGQTIPFSSPKPRWGGSAVSADGSRFAWISPATHESQPELKLHDVPSGELLSTSKPVDGYLAANPVLSPDGRYALVTGDRCVFRPIDADNGRVVNPMPDHLYAIESLSFTPDGSKLLAGSRDRRQVWNAKSGEVVAVLSIEPHSSYCQAISDVEGISLRSGRQQLVVHDLKTGEPKRHLDLGGFLHSTRPHCQVGRNTIVVETSASEGRQIKQLDLGSGRTLNKRNLPTPKRLMGTGGEEEVLAPGGSQTYRREQKEPPSKLPNGRLDWGETDLVLSDRVSQEVTSRIPLPALSGIGLVISDNEKLVVVSATEDWQAFDQRSQTKGSTFLIFWDTSSKEARCTIKRERGSYYSSFSQLAITHDGKIVASLRDQKHIEIWDGSSGHLLQSLQSPRPVTVMDFSRDGNRLGTGHDDGTIRIWDTGKTMSLL